MTKKNGTTNDGVNVKYKSKYSKSKPPCFSLSKINLTLHSWQQTTLGVKCMQGSK